MKDTSWIWAIVVIAVLVFAFLLLNKTEILGDTNLNFESNNADTSSTTSEETIQLQSLSNYFHNVIDPVAPNYFDNRSGNCELAGGTWIDTDDKIGCWGITFWDSSLCFSAEIQLLEDTCMNLDETHFTCNSARVGCYY